MSNEANIFKYRLYTLLYYDSKINLLSGYRIVKQKNIIFISNQ